MAAASLYIACREESVPRTFVEISTISKVSKQKIVNSYKVNVMIKYINSVIFYNFQRIIKKVPTSVSVPLAEQFTSRFCSTLSLSHNIQVASTYIAKVLQIPDAQNTVTRIARFQGHGPRAKIDLDPERSVPHERTLSRVTTLVYKYYDLRQ